MYASANRKVTQIHRVFDAKKIAPITGFDVNKIKHGTAIDYNSLSRNLGINIAPRELAKMVKSANDARQAIGMDALQPTVTTGSIVTPIQFLQEWLPGFIDVITQARKIDECVGMVTAGEWHYEEVVQGVKELTGLAQPYGDFTNVPLASWNTNFVYRTIVRFEEGMFVGILQEAIAAEINVNSGASDRESCALALEIARNLVGFYGYNNGLNSTYGLLTDPNLPAYVPFADGASTDPEWSTKDFLEITRDLRTMFSALRTQSGDNINPRDTDTTLILATAVVDYMTTTSNFGETVEKWLKDNYPRCRVVSAPEFDGANGGANVAYLFADKIKDSSTDGGQTFIQVVPAKFKVTGVMKKTKGYEEDYTNATAGILLKRPWAIVRYTGN